MDTVRPAIGGAVALPTASASFGELRLDGVTRAFGGIVALAGLSLTVRSGEFITLLGPSGCGKSTALNCIAGLLPLTAGSNWLDHPPTHVPPPQQRAFAIVFPNYAPVPPMRPP